MASRSLRETVQLYVNIGDHVQVTVNGGSYPGEVIDINDHFMLIRQRDGLYLLFWRAVDAVRKSTAPKRPDALPEGPG